ncbi:MAG: LuxR C-terminal-related transcriptional regulator [Cyanobacteria bacterium J06600_6]
MINPTRLLFELQKIERLNQSLSGCLQPQEIAAKITDGLIDESHCAFARIWLVNGDRTALNLVASSGLYTRLNGDFARVPMGKYKVGKIAQHCIPFLSNQLAEESWVKDSQWAIDNKIHGFAGLPIAIAEQAIGVLAVFSNQPLETEFLEALKILCSSLAVALNNASLYQEKSQFLLTNRDVERLDKVSISEQISSILPDICPTLVGTEKPLDTAGTYILLKTTEIIKAHNCSYCRLTYESDRLLLEAMLILEPNILVKNIFRQIALAINNLNGKLHLDLESDNIVQLKLALLYQQPLVQEIALSEREQEMIQLLAQGMRDREIANKLFISDRTVKFHINNAVTKLNAKTRIQAVHQAYSQGLLTSVIERT